MKVRRSERRPSVGTRVTMEIPGGRVLINKWRRRTVLAGDCIVTLRQPCYVAGFIITPNPPPPSRKGAVVMGGGTRGGGGVTQMVGAMETRGSIIQHHDDGRRDSSELDRARAHTHTKLDQKKLNK